MPKLTKSLPKYCKHKASGQAVVTLDSRDYYLGPHGSKTSIVEYDRLIAEYLANGRSRPLQEHESLKVAQVILKYWRYAERYYVKNGKQTQEAHAIKTVLRPVRRLYGQHPVSEFGPLALKAIRDEWVRAGHSRGTINKNVQRIVRVFRWAASEELIPVEIPQTLSMVPGLKKGRTDARETAPCLGSTEIGIYKPASSTGWRHRAGRIEHRAQRFFALRKHRREEGGIARHRRPSTFHLARRSSWSSPELYPPTKPLRQSAGVT